MCGFHSDDFLFFPSFFGYFGSEMENNNCVVFVFWMDMINQDLKKKTKNSFFLVFETCPYRTKPKMSL